MEYLHQHEPFNWLDVQPGMVVLDIGAFEGWYTLTAATRVGPAGLVVALEPHPISYIGLLRNIGLNQLANVIALPMCAWETDGTLRLNHEDRRVWVNAAPDGRGSSRSAVSLDALCRGLGLERVDFVKMDVEGAERRVLAGSREMLRLYRPRLFVEIHGSLLEIERHLEESGYRVALCQASGIEPERGWHGWVLAEPRA
jgi:FkbM family methyltransferase